MNRLLACLLTVTGFGLAASPGGAAATQSLRHGAWIKAVDMPAPVMSHQAVLLRDGRVMILGGEPLLDMPVGWTQVYNPSTRKWSIENNMYVARIGFTATTLRDGRVLAVGGIGANMIDLASAEIWNPRTGTWSMLPNLRQTRFSQSASLLRDGRVLIVGGVVNGSISRSTVIFDPVRNVFLAGPPTHAPHSQMCAVVMRDGRVLIAGGYGGNPEIFDAHTNTWTITGGTTPRIRPLMAPLPDGSVLMAGGTSRVERDLRTASVFHLASNQWIETRPLHHPRNSEFGAALPDGRVLVAGGQQVNDHLLKTTELYDPRNHTWTMTTPMHAARSGASSILLPDGSLLVCGGANFTGALSSCESFHGR